MENVLAEMKAALAALSHKVAKIELEHAEDRVFFKALDGNVNSLSSQVQNLDKLVEVTQKTAEGQPKATPRSVPENAKEMSLTEIGALFKTDPAAAREAMEAQGMKIGTEYGPNPWKTGDKIAQHKLMASDPVLAKRLEADATVDYSHLR